MKTSIGRFKRLSVLPNNTKQREYITKYVNDVTLMELLNVALNPDFKQGRKVISSVLSKGTHDFDLSILIQLLTSNDKLSIIKYVESLGKDSRDLLDTLVATKFKVLHPYVIDIRLKNSTSLRNLNEIPSDYGAPAFPCYIQCVPDNVVYYNVLKTRDFTKITTKDGLGAGISNDIFTEIRKLKYVGRFIGYVKNNEFVITNSYTFGEKPEILSKRISQLERLTIRTKHIKVIPTHHINNMLDVFNYVKFTSSGTVLLKQDKVPRFGRSNNVVSINVENIKRLEF